MARPPPLLGREIREAPARALAEPPSQMRARWGITLKACSSWGSIAKSLRHLIFVVQQELLGFTFLGCVA